MPFIILFNNPTIEICFEYKSGQISATYEYDGELLEAGGVIDNRMVREFKDIKITSRGVTTMFGIPCLMRICGLSVNRSIRIMNMNTETPIIYIERCGHLSAIAIKSTWQELASAGFDMRMYK